MTWKAGVDVLSFGATKNGAMAAEAVVFFDRRRLAQLRFRRKRGGHLFSKMRLLSAQLEAYLADDSGSPTRAMPTPWRAAGRRADAARARPCSIRSRPTRSSSSCPPPCRRPAGRRRASIPGRRRPGERAFRLVTAFDTDPADVDTFLSIAKHV